MLNKPFEGKAFIHQVETLLKSGNDHKNLTEASQAIPTGQNIYHLRSRSGQP